MVTHLVISLNLLFGFILAVHHHSKIAVDVGLSANDMLSIIDINPFIALTRLILWLNLLSFQHVTGSD